MSLFVFDKEQKLTKLIPNKNIVNLVHEEMINKPDVLSGEMKLSEWKSIRERPHYVAVRADDGYSLHFFKVTNVTENINTIDIKGVSLAHDELQGYGYIKDRRFVDADPLNVLSAILDGTDWDIDRFDIPPQRVTINFYYVSRLEALNLLIEKLDAEVTFRVIFSGNSIYGKVVNVLKEISKFKGKRFTLGTNLIDVVGEEDTSTIYTALIGRGKGETSVDEEGEETGGYGRRITFEDLEWKKEHGDPLNKPLGQPYLENPQATELYGYADGTPRMGIVEFPDLEYPENVLKATYNQLLQVSRPQKQFKAVVDKVGDMELGETVAIIKPGTNFRYMTRVFKVKRDHLDNSYTEVEFGDRLIKTLGETLRLTKEDTKNKVADDILDSNSDINQAINSMVKTGSLAIISDVDNVPSSTTEHTAAIITSEWSSASGNCSQVNSSTNSTASGSCSQVNSSSDSTARFGFTQVISSTSSTARGAYSQVNSSSDSTARGAHSQVNSSYYSTASGHSSQVNSSGDSTASKQSSQVNASLGVINDIPYSSAWGYLSQFVPGDKDPSTANINAQIFSTSGDIKHSGELTSGHNFTDYAELFPNLTQKEQGYGLIQTIDGYGVRPANKGEYIVGVTSATAGVILGDTPFTWANRWLTDEWGATIYHDVLDMGWEPNIEEGELESDRPTVSIPKENPEWDPEREHIDRRSRPEEWTVVGLVGQVYVRLNKDVEVMDYVEADNEGVGCKSDTPTKIRVMKITTPYDNDNHYQIGFCTLG